MLWSDFGWWLVSFFFPWNFCDFPDLSRNHPKNHQTVNLGQFRSVVDCSCVTHNPSLCLLKSWRVIFGMERSSMLVHKIYHSGPIWSSFLQKAIQRMVSLSLLVNQWSPNVTRLLMWLSWTHVTTSMPTHVHGTMTSTVFGRFGEFLGVPDLVQDKARKAKFFFNDNSSANVHFSSHIQVWYWCGSNKVTNFVHLASPCQEVPNQPFFHWFFPPHIC